MPEITCQTKGCPAYGKAFTIMAGTLECGLCGYAPHDIKDLSCAHLPNCLPGCPYNKQVKE